MMSMTESELAFISEAKAFFENNSILLRLSNMAGKPIDRLIKVLPEKTQSGIASAVQKSMRMALKVALDTAPAVRDKSWKQSLIGTRNSRLIHSGLTAATGAIGGFFGIPGAIAELPFSTTLIMRNITEIAASFNFDAREADIAMECMYVLSLGTRSENDNEMDSAYLSSRMALASILRNGAEFIATNTAKVVLENIEKNTAPQILNLIARIATMFEITVTEKLLAEAIPVVGAVGGAGINVAFTDFFGRAAKYHFGMLDLERRYGKEYVHAEYKAVLIES